MKMLYPGLSTDLRVLIHSALKEGKSFKKLGIKFKSGGVSRVVDVVASPVTPTGVAAHCLVLFTETLQSS